MQIIVSAISKYGVLDANSQKWVNWEQNNPKKLTFDKGKAYDVVQEKVKGSDGKTRTVMVKAVKVELAGDKPVVEAPKAAVVAPKVEAPKPVAKAAKVEEKTDWAAKDRSQLVGGRSHDAVLLAIACVKDAVSMTELLIAYKEALQGVLEIANEVK